MLLRYCSLNDGVPGTQIRIICGLNGKQSSLMCWENLLLFFAIRNNIKYILLQLSMETSADPKPNPSPTCPNLQRDTVFLQNKRAKEIVNQLRFSNFPSTSHSRHRGWEGEGDLDWSWEFYIVNCENPYKLPSLIPASLSHLRVFTVGLSSSDVILLIKDWI